MMKTILLVAVVALAATAAMPAAEASNPCDSELVKSLRNVGAGVGADCIHVYAAGCTIGIWEITCIG